MPNRRVFSEQQVSEIIRRAAEHQARQKPVEPHASSGVNEVELRRVAKELGIDESALQLAMSEVGAVSLDDTGTLDSVDRILERSVQGELSSDDMGVVIQEFTPAGGWNTQPINVGSTLSYPSFAGLAQCQLNVSKRSGKTTLRVKSNAFLAFFPTFFPAIFLSIITNVIIWEEMRPGSEAGIVFAVLLPVLFLTLAYRLSKRLIRYSNKKVLELTNRTAAKLEESSDHLRGNLGRSGIPLPEVEGNAEQTRI